jgi:hypothetical protein
MATKLLEGNGPNLLAVLSSGKLCTVPTQIARIDRGKVYSGSSSRVVLTIKDGAVYQGSSSRPFAIFADGKLSQGTKQLARFDRGKIYAGTTSKQIGKIDGQADEDEIIALMCYVLELF